jgi:hypothetical protein
MGKRRGGRDRPCLYCSLFVPTSSSAYGVPPVGDWTAPQHGLALDHEVADGVHNLAEAGKLGKSPACRRRTGEVIANSADIADRSSKL